MKTLIGHARAITHAAFFADDTRLLSSSADGTAKVWDVARGTSAFTLQPHLAAVTDAAVSPDGQHIVTVSDDYGVRVWSATTGELRHVHKAHTSRVARVAFAADGSCATASNDGSVRVWSKNALQGQGESVRCGGHAYGAVAVRAIGAHEFQSRSRGEMTYVLSSRGQVSAEKTKKKDILPWPSRSGALPDKATFEATDEGELLVTQNGVVRVIGTHDDVITVATASADGRWLVTGAADGSLSLWDWRLAFAASAKTARTRPPLERMKQITLTDIEPELCVENSTLFVGARDRVVALDPRTLAVLGDARSEGYAMAITNGVVAFMHVQHAVKLIDVVANKTIATLPLQPNIHGRIAVWAKYFTFFMPTNGGTLHVVDRATGEERAALSPTGDATTAHYDDRRYLLTCRADEIGGARLWDLQEKTLIAPLSWRDGKAPNTVAFNTTHVFISTRDGFVYAFELASGAPAFELKPIVRERAWVPLVLSPTGDRVVTHGNNGRHAYLWDAKTGQQITRLFDDKAHGSLSGVHVAAFSADGTRLIAAHDIEPLLRFHDARTGEVLAQHDVHRGGRLRDVAYHFFADGKKLLTFGGLQDRGLRMWDVASGKRVASYLGVKRLQNGNLFEEVVLSPDGRMAAFVQQSAPGPLLIDLSTGERVAQIDTHSDVVRAPVFYGDRIVTADDTGSIQMWKNPLAN